MYAASASADAVLLLLPCVCCSTAAASRKHICAKHVLSVDFRIDKEGFSNITLHNPLDEGQGLLDTSAFDLIITMDAGATFDS